MRRDDVVRLTKQIRLSQGSIREAAVKLYHLPLLLPRLGSRRIRLTHPFSSTRYLQDGLKLCR